MAKFHVQGDISNYTADQIGIIKETVAAIVRCDKEEIHLNGFCKSTSFFVVLSIKESCMEGLFNMKEQDKEKLISLNINYFIVDSCRVYLQNSKGNFCYLTEGAMGSTNLPKNLPKIFILFVKL